MQRIIHHITKALKLFRQVSYYGVDDVVEVCYAYGLFMFDRGLVLWIKTEHINSNEVLR